MPSPNFLIIGAQKSGSSWLARHLRNHPDVFMPRGEIHFFDKEFNFARERPDGRRVIFAVRDQAPDSADPSPADRWASFRSTRHGGDIWVMDGI